MRSIAGKEGPALTANKEALTKKNKSTGLGKSVETFGEKQLSFLHIRRTGDFQQSM